MLRLLLKLGQACIKRKGRFGRKQLAEVIGLQPGSNGVGLQGLFTSRLERR